MHQLWGKARLPGRRSQIGPRCGHQLLDLVGVVADQGVALVVVQPKLEPDTPGRRVFQRPQRLPSRAAAHAAQREMFLPPAQHHECARIQRRNGKWRPIERAGRRRRGQRDAWQIGGQADPHKSCATRGVRIDAGSLQCRKDLGRALIEHGNEQVLGSERDAEGVGEQSGGSLCLPVEIPGASTENVKVGSDDCAEARVVRGVQCVRSGSDAFRDSDQEMCWAARRAELIREPEAAVQCIPVRPA